MADITIAPQTLSKTETNPTFTTLNATDTYYVSNTNQRTILYFKNTGGTASTVTFDVTQTIDGLTITDHTISVPATTGERVVGALAARFQVEGGSFDGKIKFTQNQASGVTVAAFAI